MISKIILKNSLWMMAEKLFSLIGLIFVNSYMAKAIGPDSFGKISFVTSIFLFIQTFAWFGGQNVIFKRLSVNIRSGMSLALSTQLFRRKMLIVISFCVLFYLYFDLSFDVFIIALSNVIASFYIVSDVFSILNNVNLKSHVNTVTNVIGLLSAIVSRYIITFLNLPIYWYSVPILLIAVVPYILRVYYFNETSKNLLINKNKKYSRYYLITGSSLILSTLSVVAYSQISNIFLAKIASYQMLGIYAVALTIGGAWSFILQSLISSYFPQIYNEKNDLKAMHLLRNLNVLIIIISILVFVGFKITDTFIIQFLYGNAYLQAIDIIPIIIIATSLSGLGTVSYRFLIKKNAYKYLSIKMFAISIFSILISFVLIRHYDVYGAAWCFVIIEFISCTIANYFFSNGIVFKTHLNIFLGVK